jgi:hypothetical protein
MTKDAFREISDAGELEGTMKYGRGLDLQVMDAETMNDPWEGLFLIDRARSFRADSSDRKRKLYSLFEDATDTKVVPFDDDDPIFVCSFSSDLDNLDLWRHYCNAHGVCLVFTPSADVTFYTIEYGDEAADVVLEQLGWVLEPILEKYSDELNRKARAIIRPIRYLFKSKGHMSDQEFRIVESTQDWQKMKMEGSGNDEKSVSSGNDEKSVRRLYLLHEGFFYSRKSPADKVIVGPLAPTLDVERGDRAFLKEVKWRLHRFALGDIPVVRSKHILRY